MKRKTVALVLGGLLAAVGSAAAAQPPGQRGYEGRPGNQGGKAHHGQVHPGTPPGLRGHEGRPGNQGG